MKKINKFALTIFTWLNIFFTSCTLNFKVDDNLQKQYGADYYYFIGLKEVQKNNKKNALRYFNHAISKGSTYVKIRSYEQKIKLGNIQKQIEEAKKYLSIYSALHHDRFLIRHMVSLLFYPPTCQASIH